MLPLPAQPRIGFFVSHRGSNMRAIVDACDDGSVRAEPAILISNNKASKALEWAKDAKLRHVHLSSKSEGSEQALDAAHLEALREAQVDLIVLAGYMRKIGPLVLRTYANRILNIHPALLPRYGGQGMYGHYVHEAVIAAGDAESGVTVHLVDSEYDTGPIVDQARVTVYAGDTAETLAARVLKVEHRFFPETLARIVSGKIDLDSLL